MEVFETFEIGGLTLCVSARHRFGTDAVKLAEFAAPRGGQTIADLCTGCGIIPFLLIAQNPAKIYALDIDEEAIALLRQSIEQNALENIIVPVHEDLKNITQIPAGSVDVVTMNPPYYKADSGFKREGQSTARHELLCDLDDAVRAAAKLLKFGGRLKMCHIPERLADVICALRTHGLEPKVIELVTGGKSEPWLMLVDAKKGGKSGVKIKMTN